MYFTSYITYNLYHFSRELEVQIRDAKLDGVDLGLEDRARFNQIQVLICHEKLTLIFVFLYLLFYLNVDHRIRFYIIF